MGVLFGVLKRMGQGTHSLGKQGEVERAKSISNDSHFGVGDGCGMCEVGSQLKTLVPGGRQPLKLSDLPVHGRMLISHELVSSCAKRRPNPLSLSPYVTGKDMENMPNSE